MESLENINFALECKGRYTLTGKNQRLFLRPNSYKRSNLFGGQIIGFHQSDGLSYHIRLDLTDRNLILVFQRLVEKVTGKPYSKKRVVISAHFRDDTDPFKVDGLFLLVTELYKDGEWCLRANYIREEDDV